MFSSRPVKYSGILARMPGKLLRRLGRDRAGAVAVLFALSSTVLIGFVGLGTEVALWYIDKSAAQGAADTAAYSALIAFHAGDINNFADTAKAVAAQYGFVDQQNGVAVKVNQPPQSGAYTSNPFAIEVVIIAPQVPLFSRLFVAAPSVAARAVADSIAGAKLVE
jgi:Flp pilus assembly protein TadG